MRVLSGVPLPLFQEETHHPFFLPRLPVCPWSGGIAEATESCAAAISDAARRLSRLLASLSAPGRGLSVPFVCPLPCPPGPAPLRYPSATARRWDRPRSPRWPFATSGLPSP